MKKIIALLLTLVLVFSLSSCGVVNITNEDEKTNADGVEKNDTKGDGNDKKEISFTEMTAVDNDECSIKITGIEPDALFGYSLKVLLENKSSEKTYMFSVDDAYVNGVKCSTLFATEVAAGKKANEKITLMDDELKENGITEYTDIELSLRVYDSDDWAADDVAEETVHIYPYGENNAEKFERASEEGDTVIFDNDYAKAIVIGYEDDEIWGFTAKIFLVNKSDKNIMFSVDEASVNGFMADPFFANSVDAGKCAFGGISWSDSTLEENGITEVETIELKFKAHDADDIFEDDYANVTVTLEP